MSSFLFDHDDDDTSPPRLRNVERKRKRKRRARRSGEEEESEEEEDMDVESHRPAEPPTLIPRNQDIYRTGFAHPSGKGACAITHARDLVTKGLAQNCWDSYVIWNLVPPPLPVILKDEPIIALDSDESDEDDMETGDQSRQTLRARLQKKKVSTLTDMTYASYLSHFSTLLVDITRQDLVARSQVRNGKLPLSYLIQLEEFLKFSKNVFELLQFRAPGNIETHITSENLLMKRRTIMNGIAMRWKGLRKFLSEISTQEEDGRIEWGSQPNYVESLHINLLKMKNAIEMCQASLMEQRLLNEKTRIVEDESVNIKSFLAPIVDPQGEEIELLFVPKRRIQRAVIDQSKTGIVAEYLSRRDSVRREYTERIEITERLLVDMRGLFYGVFSKLDAFLLTERSFYVFRAPDFRALLRGFIVEFETVISPEYRLLAHQNMVAVILEQGDAILGVVIDNILPLIEMNIYLEGSGGDLDYRKIYETWAAFIDRVDEGINAYNIQNPNVYFRYYERSFKDRVEEEMREALEHLHKKVG